MVDDFIKHTPPSSDDTLLAAVVTVVVDDVDEDRLIDENSSVNFYKPFDGTVGDMCKADQ